MEIELKYKLGDKEKTMMDSLYKDFQATRDEMVHMEARYYDTENMDFMKRQISLRQRKENNQLIANIKAGESYEKGLFIRQEWEKEINHEDEIDFHKWFQETEAEKILSEILGKGNQLMVVVETIFTREKATFYYKDSLLEAALDKGYILGCGKKSDIHEIEIELLKGKQEDIEDFGKNVMEKIYGLEPEVLSKYARGLKLIHT